MSYDNDQNEPNLPVPGSSNKRKSESFLPRFFRTPSNKKFLNSTLDQLIQPGVVEKLNGYIGRETAKAFTATDNYLGDVSNDRVNYQLEPTTVIKDNLDNVVFYKDYNDFTNQLTNFNKSNDNHSVFNQQEYYAWNPNIDWDKFSNFREYYWLPSGPQTIGISGNTVDVESTYTVRIGENADNETYIFSPDGLTQNPTITLYRGITYKFDIDTPNLPFTIKTQKTLEDGFELDSSSILVLDGVSIQGLEKGVSTLQLGTSTPDVLYYVAANDLEASGTIIVKDISEATFIDVEKEVIGKKFYKSSNGIELSNGMKIEFTGEVVPETYARGTFYVEGVGDKINLVSETKLNVPTSFTEDIDIQFDAQGFDRLPYSKAIGYPEDKDYIVINRASIDGNLWSRYNRWFHKSVIEESALFNNEGVDINQLQRAKRPIIEFEANLKLHNFGTSSKLDVDLVDDFTKDAFSIIEGSEGYNVDGIDLADGMRIVFTADPDTLVAGRIFKVKFINFTDPAGGVKRQITLIPETDSIPITNEVVLILNGITYKGKMLYYTGTAWKLTQDKIQINQAPVFDIFDVDGNSYADTTVYESSTFTGNKVFCYKTGTGVVDSELNIPISYRSINNIGDIVFNFSLLNDSFTYTFKNESFSKKTDIGFLRKYSNLSNFVSVSGWKKVSTPSEQLVIRQYVFDNTITALPIDMYDNSGELTDLWTRVYLNNKLQFKDTDYTIINDINNIATINFTNALTINDVVIIKTRSSATKNENGYYEIPASLERNPANENITEFTLGEVNDHIATIVEQSDTFVGTYPGTSNLRDIGNVTELGRRFVQHSSPMNLALYHMLDNDANVMKSIKFAMNQYTTFKRLFLQTAEDIIFSGTTKLHVDAILEQINKDKTSTQPFFFSDMTPTGATRKLTTTVIDSDDKFYPLSAIFSLSTPSRIAVQVYLNEVQLVHGKDYTFNNEGYVVVTATKSPDDIIDIYEYETTNGSFVPPTPSKLGLYPSYEPAKYLDNTYQTPKEVIQGHDGSKIIAFNDYRDDLLLELEKRIYNNIKVAYDNKLLDINSLLGGEHRDTGVTKKHIDRVILSDFVQWSKLIDQDYTLHNFFDRGNSFTFNYAGSTGPSGKMLPGFWRQIYQQAYDTDRPHTHPWEMLGFSVMPTWWETQYGPAPYTKENLLLWQDLEAGIVRQPNVKYKILNNFKRPGLVNHIPADSNGNLVSPIESGYINTFDNQLLDRSFVFGDGAPVESAWRSSSQYPFSIISAFAVNKPHTLFATGFDRINQIRNVSNELVYKTTGTRIQLTDLLFPNTYEDTSQIYTSGLVNYIANYLTSDVTTSYTTYKTNIKNIKNQLGHKLAGFTDKEKFKLILDSRSPTNNGNVFVPDENYKVFLNTSTPVKTVSYSGVIIERRSDGYVIKGYDNEIASFKYYAPISAQADPSINIGGISESYLIWDSNKAYVQGQNLEYQGTYYRVKANFVSSQEFDTTNLSKLAALPLIGGRSAFLRRSFNKNIVTESDYGHLFTSIQDVVDFLLGYGNYLEDQGFVFDYYEGDAKVVLNWRHSVNEFLFWTTQNWGEGSVITLSPASTQLKFQTEYAMVDNIFDSFYGHSLLQSDGTKLVQEFSLLGRSANEFVIRSKNTANGIYAVKLPLIQKEHALLIDNKTVFGDVIYDTQPGYRQERIKVLGYITQEWDGSLNIPGFVYDEAKTTSWMPWTDYAIGSIVKYKEFYYSSSTKLTGTESFNAMDWNRLDKKPEAGLFANFEYKTNQFADFYDLDSDNFDTEQQRLSQHLIGYQKRQYLENIINDDVSQYKFYQGMIQDKGTKNALTKLFDVLSSADKDSLEFYEEWAIKAGQYGASEGFTEYELLLDESKFRLTPQPIDLVTSTTGKETDLVYRILPYEVYQKTPNYDHKPFPEKYVDTSYVKDAGYVNPDDVRGVATNYNNIIDFNFADINRNDYIWVGNDQLSWNVYKHIDTDYRVESVTEGTTSFKLTLTTNATTVSVNDIIGLHSFNNYIEYTGEDSAASSTTEKFELEGFYLVSAVDKNVITVLTNDAQDEIPRCFGSITQFSKVRAENITSANDILQENLALDDYIWIDNVNGTGKWKVLKNENLLLEQQRMTKTTTSLDTSFGSALASDDRNTTMLVGAPTEGNGKVYVYNRSSDSLNFSQTQVIEVSDNVAKLYNNWAPNVNYVDEIIIDNGLFYQCITPHLSDAELGFESNYFVQIPVPSDTLAFGSAVAISPDGNNIIIGSPNASDVKTKYAPGGTFLPNSAYTKGTIVSKDEQLWKSLVAIQPAVQNIEFISFNSVTQIVDTLDVENDNAVSMPVLVIGNYAINPITEQLAFANQPATHMLIRAPLTQYEGSEENDLIKVAWNQTTYSNQDLPALASRSPFNGSFANINAAFLEQTHTIQKKIDVVLYIDASTNFPAIGDILQTETASGIVDYVYNDGAEIVIYLKDVNGVFNSADSIFRNDGDYVGEYIKQGPISSVPSDVQFGGFWFIDTPSYTPTVSTENADAGRGLVFYDVITDSVDGNTLYANSLDYNTDTFSSQNTDNAYIEKLSYQGLPGAYGSNAAFLSNLYVVRAPKMISDEVNQGDIINLYVNQLPQYSTGIVRDLASIGLSTDVTNSLQTVYDVWDGYININYTKFNVDDTPFEPKIGQIVEDLTTGATAEVTFYQRNSLNATLFVKSVTGTWSNGYVFSDNAEIKFKAIPGDPSPTYQVDRTIGQIQYVSLGLPDEGIGKLFVFQSLDIIPLTAGSRLLDIEYWLYQQYEVSGRARLANIPSAVNNEWTQVYQIPAEKTGTASGLTNEGMYSVYSKIAPGKYSITQNYTVPEKQENFKLGSSIKITKNNNLYRGFIHAGSSLDLDTIGTLDSANDLPTQTSFTVGVRVLTAALNDSTQILPDLYYNIENIVDGGSNFDIGDTIVIRGNLLGGRYTDNDAVLTVTSVSISGVITGVTILGTPYFAGKVDPQIGDINTYTVYGNTQDSKWKVDNFIYSWSNNAWTTTQYSPGKLYFIKNGEENGITYNWDYAKNKKFKGTFSEGLTYFTDDIVYNNGIIYAAKTNLAPSTFSVNEWTAMSDLVDYVGFIPNSTGRNVSDSTTILNQIGLEDFASQFDVSLSGEVLVVNALYNNQTPNQIVVYRSNNGHFEKSQEIPAPDKTSAFGQSISISSDGTLIAISSPLNDDYLENQGLVYIYKQINGTFVLSQTLKSLNNERAELFGWKIEFDGEKLYISAKNADSKSRSYFDNYSTVFDGGFTDFKTINEDAGVIYVYEKIEAELLLAQTIQISDSTVKEFGQNILAKNNHLYVGLSKKVDVSGNYTGSVLNFANNKTQPMWTEHSTAKSTVDISKIKKMFLYDTKENLLLTPLDYIDPIQGKVAGVAEQELTFKTYYDPALYDLSTASDTIIDVTNSWGSEHIGEVWWNLTNAKFYNPYQGDTIFSTQNWSKVFQGNTIDVYEWVESNVLPSVWDAQADTENGFAKGYSGTSLYGDTAYSTKRKYNNIAGTFTTIYYFWVSNKKTVPNVEFRKINISDIADYIKDPVAKGYTFAGLISPTSFVLYNAEGYIKGTDVALSAQFWTIENQDQNIHTQYQIISEGLETSQPNKDIIKKWYDSLIGYDEQDRIVPDPTLSTKQKYGALNTPRQSWFVNRAEALKQVIERTNLILNENLIVDDKVFTTLSNLEIAPTQVSNIWDASVDTIDDLEFIGVARASQAILSPVVINGKISSVNIVDPGRGYRVPPTVTVTGNGTGAILQTAIDTVGRITSVTVTAPGENYNNAPILTVRKFTVLVNSDSTIQGKWALYERINDPRSWNRIQSQSYNVNLYWDYSNWYASGYSQLTEIDYLIDNSYELTSLNNSIGDIVKISSIGSGGWLLLKKIDSQDTEDYTINYSTIGRQNGTIQFKSTLYDSSEAATGFDTISFDTKIYDSEPTIELRIILESIKNDLFIDDLLVKFNSLFFASLRYAFSEQTYIDWAFKTSFIKAKHNVGSLRKDVTFNNDNLPSYESYIKEVKPFGTKVREYLSAYESLDNTNTTVTDFDLPPAYNSVDGKIVPQDVKVQDGVLVGVNADFETYPNKNWLDNSGYKIVKVEVVNPGSGYKTAPVLTLSGTGGAVLKANIGNGGKISSVTVVSPGAGYYYTPTITSLDNIEAGGEVATYSVQIGDNPVRGLHSTVKFDRTTGTYVYTSLSQTETFIASGSEFEFDLIWPMDLLKSNIKVYVNNQEALNSEYTYKNLLDITKGYDRHYGQITFTNAPAINKSVRIEYKKSVDLMQAQDRINNYYTPTTGMPGKDLNQLMTGLDYGGVEVTSLGFGKGQGWDADGWYNDTWDSYDTTFEDEIFELDGSTISLELDAPLASSVVYNIYKNGVRVDDVNYGTATPVTNPNAICQSITGDGTTTIVFLDNDGLNLANQAGDIIIIRKSTSDGTYLPDPNSYDTSITGGALNYSTATGLNAEDIVIDGDGFVTATTSGGPEELVPGQVLDTIDIKVYERPQNGSSQITSRNYTGNGTTKEFSLDTSPLQANSLFVKVGYNIISAEEYTINYATKTVTFDVAPVLNAKIHFAVLGISGTEILDIDNFIADGSTSKFLTNVRFDTDLQYFIALNGQTLNNVIEESDDSYAYPNNAVISFAVPPEAGSVISYAFFKGDKQNFSEVSIDTFTADGSTTVFDLAQTPFNNEPSAWFSIVKVNNKILNAGYNRRFVTTAAKREYQLEEFQIPPGTVNNKQIKVFLNNKELSYNSEWTFTGTKGTNGSLIRLKPKVKQQDGDILTVFITNDGEYRYGYFDSANEFVSAPGELYLDSAYNDGDIITVYQFSNHDSQGFDRQQYDIVDRVSLTVGTDDWYTYNHLTAGLIELAKPALDAQYVWVTLNGNLLTPSMHYYVTENKRYVKINISIEENDVIEILQFSNTILSNKYGWRQFKDILNRTHYKRLDDRDGIMLATDLNWYDQSIEVTDGTTLPDPVPSTNIPGILFINGERIEYFVRNGNVLSQLRRGTLGTGVKAIYLAGENVYNQSQNATMPYKDETLTSEFLTDGTTATYELDFIPGEDGVNEFEVFVAGKRLRKNAISSYVHPIKNGDEIQVIAQDSPEGDVTLPAEFSIEGSVLTLLSVPEEPDIKVNVVRKTGIIWKDAGISLSESESDISRFLRAATVDLPR